MTWLLADDQTWRKRSKCPFTTFDWKSVVPGEPETYPIAPQPSDGDFLKVRTVQEEKVKEARRTG